MLPISSKSCVSDESSSKMIKVLSLDKLSSDVGSLCLTETCADVYFLVEGERVPGHKAILGSRSEYFRALLFGPMSESSKSEIVLPELSARSFKVLLKFVYSGKLTFSSDMAFDLLEIANQLGVVPVEEAITSYFQEHLSLYNIVDAFNAACIYSLQPLQEACITFVRVNFWKLILKQLLNSLIRPAIELILQKSLYVPDNVMYKVIADWCKTQGNESEEFISTYLETHCLSPQNKGIFIDLGTEKELNFFELKLQDKTKRFTYLVEGSRDKENWFTIADTSQYRVNCTKLCFPGQRIKYLNLIKAEGDLIIEDFKIYFIPSMPAVETNMMYPTMNVATPEMGASANSVELLNGNMTNYGGMHGFAEHEMNGRDALFVSLSQPYLIDSLRLLLWDGNYRYYHYYIDCSLDNENWTRIVDRTTERSRSWQNFRFQPTPMMYIKIAGTFNSDASPDIWTFHCVHFECPSQSSVNIVDI